MKYTILDRNGREIEDAVLLPDGTLGMYFADAWGRLSCVSVDGTLVVDRQNKTANKME
ncbi:hypothetical protein M0R36_11230 [bacterium]|jgi:hypothetical protein|nr:hypothetical protein [bacterium]